MLISLLIQLTIQLSFAFRDKYIKIIVIEKQTNPSKIIKTFNNIRYHIEMKNKHKAEYDKQINHE